MSHWDAETATSLEIAVIGMSGRFPGARNVQEFWSNLRNSVEGITFFTDQEMVADGARVSDLQNPNLVKACGVIGDADRFDAGFFGIAPREAELMDPQQRIFLECAWEALEDAGYDSETYPGAIGVYAGSALSLYLVRNILGRQAVASADTLQIDIGSDKDFLATLISYKLNLRGPSVSVQTACSTSLVSIHLACQSLISGETDLVLAGGISVATPEKTGYVYLEGAISSPDGHCRAFDAKAAGTVPGNGVGIVVLKRLSEAISDRDRILAVIKGSAINNDGSKKVGYTAPSVEGQVKVIMAAQAAAGVSPETIQYIEAHGTGTHVGDPIEMAALAQVFRSRGDQRQPAIAVGAVKSNVGHLNTAAGVCGFIKTVLALHHNEMPPTLHFEQPNPELHLEDTPLYVTRKLQPWSKANQPRRAGVSSFGIGGTNAHVIVEEAPDLLQVPESGREWKLVVFSAKSQEALGKLGSNLVAHARSYKELNLADIAYTLAVGRTAHKFRSAVVARDLSEACEKLERGIGVQWGDAYEREPSVVFMFPGQGSQYQAMGKDLYETELEFRKSVDECCRLLQPYVKFDLAALIGGRISEQDLEHTQVTQPALFILEYSLAQLWMSWGVYPKAMIGHSLGEYVAACLSGVMSLDEALHLIAVRGSLMLALPPGGMLALRVSEERARSLLSAGVDLAAVNGPEFCVGAGPEEELIRLEERVRNLEATSKRLKTSHAFHSSMMDPILKDFRRAVGQVKLRPPRLPFVSNVTGTWITSDQAENPDYWVQHLRSTVRFNDGAQLLLQQPGNVCLEVGPGNMLSQFLMAASRSKIDDKKKTVIVSGLRRGTKQASNPDEGVGLLEDLGRLWTSGVRISWDSFYRAEHRQRVSLPTYPFERRRYWLEPESGETDAQLRKKRLSLEDWFYAVNWKRTRLGGSQLEHYLAASQRWLVFSDEHGAGVRLCERLRSSGQAVYEARRGSAFSDEGRGQFRLNPQDSRSFQALLQSMDIPHAIIYAWNDGIPEPTGSFDALIYLAQALATVAGNDPIRFTVLTSNVQRVLDEEIADHSRAAALGIVHVLPKENPRLRVQNIDVDLHPKNTEMVLLEFTIENPEPIVAFRHGQRWTPTIDHIGLSAHQHQPPLRQRGVYLITHALQELGMALADRLTRQFQAQVVLLDRTFFPQPNDWEGWIAGQGEDDPISRKIARLMPVRAQVRIAAVDLANQERMMRIKSDLERELGPVTGVFHLGRAGKTGLISGKSSPVSASLQADLAELAVLDKVFSNVEQLLLFSSNLAESGGLGQVEQAARNVVLACFAEKYAEVKRRVLTIEWGTRSWQEPGEGAGSGLLIQQQLEEKRRRFGMSLEESLDALERALTLELPNVIISTRDFAALMEQQHLFTADLFQQQLEQSISANGESGNGSHLRPDVSTPYEPPRNEVEKLLVDLWKGSFRFEKIGIHDNFFELGGHSLLAVQLLKNMNDTLSGRLVLKDLFDGPTIAQLALLISGTPGDSDDTKEVEALLAEIEGMSEGQLRAELDSSS